MAEFTGLQIGVPAKVHETADHEIWKTRTGESETAGSIEHRVKPGSATAAAQAREAGLATAVATLRSWAMTARSTTVTPANHMAVTQTHINNLATLYDKFADLLQSLGKG